MFITKNGGQIPIHTYFFDINPHTQTFLRKLFVKKA